MQNVQAHLGTSQMSLENVVNHVSVGRKVNHNENFRMSLQEEKEDLIEKCAQYKFRQFYSK